MTTALLVLAGVLLLVAFVGGIFVGRRSITPTGSPTPPSANALAAPEEEDAAAKAADDNAEKKADEVMHAPDDVVRDRVARLRARGRAGE